MKNLLPQGKATSVYHLVDQPDDPNEAMFDGAFTDNVKTALRHFPFVLVGAAGHARSTIAHLSKMGPYVHIGHANYEVNISSSSSEMVAFATSAKAIFRSVLAGPAGVIDPVPRLPDEQEEDQGEEQEEEQEDVPQNAGPIPAAPPPNIAIDAHHAEQQLPGLAGAAIAARARVPRRKFIHYRTVEIPEALEVDNPSQVTMLCLAIGLSFGPGVKGAGWNRSPGIIENAPNQDFGGWYQAFIAAITNVKFAPTNLENRGALEAAFDALTSQFERVQLQAFVINETDVRPAVDTDRQKVEIRDLGGGVPGADPYRILQGGERPDVGQDGIVIREGPGGPPVEFKRWGGDKAEKGVMKVGQLREFNNPQHFLASAHTTKTTTRVVKLIFPLEEEEDADAEPPQPPPPRLLVGPDEDRFDYQEQNQHEETVTAENALRERDVAAGRYVNVSTRDIERLAHLLTLVPCNS